MKYGLTQEKYTQMVKQAQLLRQADPDVWIRKQLGIEEEASAPKPKAKKKTAKKATKKKAKKK